MREVSEDTPGALPVKQDDGTVKFFVVEHRVLKPALIARGRATGPTIQRVPRKKGARR